MKDDEKRIIKKYKEIFGNALKAKQMRTRHSIYSIVNYAAGKHNIDAKTRKDLGRLYLEDSPEFFDLCDEILSKISIIRENKIMNFKCEISSELENNWDDKRHKAALSATLNISIYGFINDKWQLLKAMELDNRQDLSEINKIFEEFKSNYLNQEKVDYSEEKDPDNIPF